MLVPAKELLEVYVAVAICALINGMPLTANSNLQLAKFVIKKTDNNPEKLVNSREILDEFNNERV